MRRSWNPSPSWLLGMSLCVLVGRSSQAAAPAFSNQTSSAGVAFTHSTSSFNSSSYSGGGTVGDFNNDGFQDLFVFSGGNAGQPDRLYINNGNGTFTNQATAWGLTVAHKGKSATTGDFNNDGWLDIYATSAGPAGLPAAPGHHKLYRNNGNNTFTDVAAAAGVNQTNPTTQDSWTCCFGDYDLDGDLDLYVGGFSTSSAGNAGNRLFQNNGNETFTDVTSAIALFSGVGPIACLSASFADMNGDRYPELLLGGDFKGVGYVGSRYFKNDGDGTFTDVTVASNTGHEENGMGQALGDFNNDSRLDWYVTSIYGFPPSNWTGNKLYRNDGNHQYTQYAAAADCDDGGYGWGAVAVDFNHDGLTDIAETNGDGASSGQFANEQSYLWINDGDDTFSELAVPAGFISNGKGRCLIHFDYDNDGDQDLALMSNNEPFGLFRNDVNLSAANAHWLRVFLDTSNGSPAGPLAPNGYGSKVYATVGTQTYMRAVIGENSFLGINELSAHFGLGTASIVDELRIDWPNGSSTVLTNVAVNQTITVSPTLPCPADVAEPTNGAVDINDLLAIVSGWGTASPDITGDNIVNVADLLAAISAWGPCP